MTAPVCKIVRSQPTARTGRTLLPSIPLATDLPSLIRSVNIMTDILRTVTTSLTVNNTYYAEIPPLRAYIMSEYPDWRQVKIETTQGFIYYKSRNRDGETDTDENQRAYVSRTDLVEFRNDKRDDDESFFWKYIKPPDAIYGDRSIRPFDEDFFERVVNVHWSKKIYLFLSVRSQNARYGTGINPVAITRKPTVIITTKSGVRELDEHQVPGQNGILDGFSGCMQYEHEQIGFLDWGRSYTRPDGLLWSEVILGPRGYTAEWAFNYLWVERNSHPWMRITQAVNFSSCPIRETTYTVASISSWGTTAGGVSISDHQEWVIQLTTIPVNYISREYEFSCYLYEISPGDDILSISASDIIANPPYNGVLAQQGYVSIFASVFSTAREKLTDLSQIIDMQYGWIDYEDMLLDPDSSAEVIVMGPNTADFSINVRKTTDPAQMQTDNYGARYQPYEVTFEPPPQGQYTSYFTGDAIRIPLPAAAGG